MKRKNLFNLLVVGGLVLALVGGIVMAHQAEAQDWNPQASWDAQTAVGTAFTYQGRLLDEGVPVDGTCGFGFSLYGSPAGADQIGTTQDKHNVPVSNGYFTVNDLDFGADAFDGNARYLQIALDCGAGAQTLEPRVALNAAPYAHSLRPGSVVKGDSTGSILSIENTSSMGAGLAAEADTASGKSPITGAALWGDSATLPGVVGTSNSAAGVFGWSTSNAGVAGVSDSGNAVVGTSSSGRGVYGEAAGSTGTPYGVYGLASHAGSATSYGVYGKSNSTVGTGVGGEAPMSGVYGKATSGGGYGVYGEATASGGYGVYGYSASGHGVHGKANPPDGYAIFSEGNTFIEGELFWEPKTSYIAVAAAAFHPAHEGYDFSNNGNSLWNQDSASDFYVAPVQLPHGAIVTELRFHWWDGSPEDGYCRLYRIDLAGSEVTMATAYTYGEMATPNASASTSVANAFIDNSQYAYYLWLNLPDNLVAAFGVVIEYTVAEPY